MEWKIDGTNGLNCTEQIIKNLAEFYKRDYELMFVGSWGFDLNRETSLLEKDHIRSNEANSWYYLKKFHGLKPIVCQNRDFSSYICCLDNLVEKKIPIIAYVDLFFIPWADHCFQKKHWKHSILICGKDQEGYICFDHFSAEKRNIPIELLAMCYNYIIYFECQKNVRPISPSECLAEIKKNITQRLIENDAFEKMNILSEEITNLSIILDDNFQTGYLMEALNRIAQCRIQISRAFSILDERFGRNEYKIISNDLLYCGTQWKTIWAMMQKAYVLNWNKNVISKISNRLTELSKKEKELCNLILEL